jgi:hypothetical protein
MSDQFRLFDVNDFVPTDLHHEWLVAWEAAIEHELEMEGRASWEDQGDTAFMWAKERAARDALVKAMLDRVSAVVSTRTSAKG